MNHPTISFTYLLPSQIGVLEEIFRETPLPEVTKQIEEISSRYVLVCHKDNQLHHDCPMFELLHHDIKNTNTHPWYKGRYDTMLEIYPPWLVKKLVIDDVDIVKEKVRTILDFAFDELYQTDIIQIEWKRCDNIHDWSSIPTLMYAWMQEWFNIEDQSIMDDPQIVVVRKRSCMS